MIRFVSPPASTRWRRRRGRARPRPLRRDEHGRLAGVQARRRSPPRAGWSRTARWSRSVGGDRVDLVTKDVYKDFDLELEWKVGPGGNSGVMYDVAETERRAVLHRPRDAGARRRGARGRQEPEDVGGLALRAGRARRRRSLKPVGRMEPGAAREEGQPRRALAERHEDRGVRARQPRAHARSSRTASSRTWPRFAKEGQGHIVLQHHGDAAGSATCG